MSEEPQADKVSHASLNGIYVKAQELDRGHNEQAAPFAAPPGGVSADVMSHASDASTHASDATTHASGGSVSISDAASHVSDESTHASDADTHSSDGRA